MLKAGILLGLLLMSWSGAHGLGVFADRDSDGIRGYVYLQGGARPADVPVKLVDVGGIELVSTVTDAGGRFEMQGAFAGALTVVAETADGHRAEFPLGAEPPPQEHADAHGVSADTLETIVARAVAAQIRPLREQLIDYENRLRLTSVVGGIGYIFGFMGLILFYKSRGRSERRA